MVLSSEKLQRGEKQQHNKWAKVKILFSSGLSVEPERKLGRDNHA